ncbi:hypothetical protein SAMN04488065_2950 [Haloplanus vescus]|uniref:DUF7837 domain-containing protein n=1 Tax=Haloplanus vescus TaxID=555874 RepID=A0A1H4AVM0_9EURY|nr:hypothetical protein SAMN04488065_2950 [Haloplanus vescus]
MRMAPDNRQAVLGTCSFCGDNVTEGYVILRYETTAGEPGVWAECPGCGEVVDPTNAQ